jgi:thiosulfate dehydrogenase (quinone) large subunit
MVHYHTGLRHFLFESKQSAWLWLVVRVYLGWQWLHAGYGKAVNPAWIGDQTGVAITGYFNNALTKTTGAHPDVQWCYAWFIENVALPNANLFSYVIVYGEIAVGIALILGLLTGVAAFFGAFMNFNFLFAGTVSINPYWILISIALMYAWKVAGYIGLDRFVLSKFRHYV